jgi:hypothetical protein
VELLIMSAPITTVAAPGKRIEKLVDSVLQPIGFAKQGQKWRRATPETICHVSLQKSRNQYYLGMDVSVIQLNPAGLTDEPVWHIIGRMFSPSVEEKLEWERCLNVSKQVVSGKPRETRLLEILQEKIAPLLQSFATLDGIKAVLFSNQLRAMGVRTELQDLTGYRA